jgi:hypothetical protein
LKETPEVLGAATDVGGLEATELAPKLNPPVGVADDVIGDGSEDAG